MKHELIERYIYAVVRHLPQKQRAEVEKELESLISDMLDERCGDILPADKDVRVVLTELGTPDELAAKYSGEEKKSLISGVYFIAYKRVLKIVLPIVAGAVLLGTVINVLFNPSENPAVFAFRLIGQPIGGMIGGVFQAFAIITFIFAALERFKADISGDYLSALPLVPKQAERIKPYEPIIGILWSIAFAVFFLAFPVAAGVWTDGEGWLPIFNVGIIRGFWPLIVLWAVLGIVKESVKLIEGRFSKRLAIVTIPANVIILVSTAVVFLNNAIINPEFVRNIGGLFTGGGNEIIITVITNFNVCFFCVVCFALLIESVTVIVKAWRFDAGTIASAIRLTDKK